MCLAHAVPRLYERYYFTSILLVVVAIRGGRVLHFCLVVVWVITCFVSSRD